VQQLHSGKSEDGVHWTLQNERIRWIPEDNKTAEIRRVSVQFTTRAVLWLEDRYYVTWCNGYHGPTIGVGYTYDFETFHQLENASCPSTATGCFSP
jgi:beta-1,4-mannooligosaccharide/beta-1,4-mannosyl-N-acetylglucosamine phosphorylase